MTNSERILVALDFDDAEPALKLARTLAGKVGGMKVGLELINAAGFDIIARLQDAGMTRIFYDAKFHDIPNTVAGAVRAATKRGVWMVNVHASGGEEMMKAAREAADLAKTPPLMIAVTVLTSMDEAMLAQTWRTSYSVREMVENLCCRAQNAGMDGVVASAQEVKQIHSTFGDGFVTVIPGIRPAGTAANDQKRVATPAQAIADGAHYLVIGRAITAADDPVLAVENIVKELKTPQFIQVPHKPSG
jgi:orotidine-5'-phosphate decarboxylase